MSESSLKKTQLIAEEAVEWLLAFIDESHSTNENLRIEFVEWLKLSPTHVKEFLYASQVLNEIQNSDTLSFIQQTLEQQNSNVIGNFQFCLV